MVQTPAREATGTDVLAVGVISDLTFKNASTEKLPTLTSAPRAWVEAAKEFERGTKTAVETISMMIRTSRDEFDARSANPDDPCNLLHMFFYELTAEQWAGKVPVDPEYIAQVGPHLTSALSKIAQLTPN